jgi:hypothetical protein
MVQHLPSMWKALHLILTTAENKTTKQKNKKDPSIFLKVRRSVEPEPTSMSFSFSVALKSTRLFRTLSGSFTRVSRSHDHVISYLEKIGALSCIDFPNVDIFSYIILKITLYHY